MLEAEERRSWSATQMRRSKSSEAGEFAHLVIHDVQAAEHGEADVHVMQAASLFLEASKTISASLAFDHVAAAIKHIRTAFEAYDQAHAILVQIDDGGAA